MRELIKMWLLDGLGKFFETFSGEALSFDSKLYVGEVCQKETDKHLEFCYLSVVRSSSVHESSRLT